MAAVEMEAAGVAAAANERSRPVELLVVRGISDLADATKNDDWQPYAMLSAFEFVATLCRAGFGDVGVSEPSAESADAVSELEEIASEYESVRGTGIQGGAGATNRQRAYYLRKLLKRARLRARGLTPIAYDVSSHLASGNEGERVVAIAMAQAADNPVVFCAPMLDALREAKSRFEQTEVLRFFEAIADELDEAQRAALIDALTFIEAQTDPSPPYPLGGDRRLLVDLIKRWMRGATGDVS